MNSDNIVFKKSWLLAIEGYASNVRCEFYEAVFTYLSCGRTVDLVSGGAKRAFASVKRDIDSETADDDRQQKISDVRRAAQRKSVEARRAKKEGSFANFANANFANSAGNAPLSRAHAVIEYNKINNQQDIKDKNKEEKKESREKETKKATGKATGKASQLKTTLPSRRAEFEKELEPFIPVYGKAMIDNFFSYWSELNPSQTKMRKELQQTWETPRRLGTWASRESSFAAGGSRYKPQNYGNNEKYDPRRGVEATYHTVEEYEEGF